MGLASLSATYMLAYWRWLVPVVNTIKQRLATLSLFLIDAENQIPSQCIQCFK